MCSPGYRRKYGPVAGSADGEENVDGSTGNSNWDISTLDNDTDESKSLGRGLAAGGLDIIAALEVTV
jgi:hypothetical protein